MFQVPGKSQDRKFTAAMAIPTPKSTAASTRFEPPSPKAKVSPATTIATRDSLRAIVLVNACCRTLTAYSQGNWPLTAQMPLMQESETERMRRRLTGASGRRTSSEGFLHCRRVPFRMMRAGHRIGIQGQLSPDLVERDGERRETKVEVAASRREAAPWSHTSTPNRRWQNRECCQQVPIRGRAAVIFRHCSSARNPARVAF